MKPVEPLVQQRPQAPLMRGRLFRKYFALILVLVSGILLISSGIGVFFSYQENRNALANLQYEKAVSASARIEQYMRGIEQQLRYAALTQFGDIKQREIEFYRLLRMVPAITDVVYIDADGREQLSVSRLSMNFVGSGKDRSRDPAFRNAKPDETWFGPVYFRKETEPYMAIAVRARQGAVTVAQVNLKFIWDVITRIKVGRKGKAYVVDRKGYLVADPDIGLVLRKTDLSALPQVRQALRGSGDDALATYAENAAGTRVLSAYAGIESLGWKVFVEQPVSEVYAKLNATIWRTAGLLVAGLLFSALAASWLARSMVRPIRSLEEGAERIGAGNLEQRIDIRTGDELESLAGQFNRMSERLRESYAGLERKVDERTAELQQALEQQTASAEILRTISSSPSDVAPVFETILDNASRLSGGSPYSAIFRFDGKLVHLVATRNWTPALDGMRSHYPAPPNPALLSGRIILSGKVQHEEDAFADPNYDHEVAAAGGWRRMLGVPMLRDGTAVGAFVVAWAEAGPIPERIVRLLETFADQAVIAIENVRLFNETNEALEQQTATAEILRVISRSVEDTRPVFRAIVDSCRRLFDGKDVYLLLSDGQQIRLEVEATSDEVDRAAVARLFPVPLDNNSGAGRAILSSSVIHVADVDAGGDVPPRMRGIAEGLRFRSIVIAPLLKERSAIGALAVTRGQPGGFSDKEIALLQTFADQAVIAIENARLFHEIEEKGRQLEIANKHKSDFLANMSHELRTPLNAVIGFSEALIEKMFGELNDKQLDYLNDIHSSGKHLLSLINDILDLSKIESGRMELDLAEVNLPAALENALTLIRERAQRHGLAVSLEVDPRIGVVRADERKLKQIMLNLLSNAVKFTPDGGSVAVSARLTAEDLEIAVADTGIGIAPEDQEAVFEEFRQVGSDYTRKAEGTGLGLALTRRFVELHGGRIRVASEPGKGSTFTFTLPLRQGETS